MEGVFCFPLFCFFNNIDYRFFGSNRKRLPLEIRFAWEGVSGVVVGLVGFHMLDLDVLYRAKILKIVQNHNELYFKNPYIEVFVCAVLELIYHRFQRSWYFAAKLAKFCEFCIYIHMLTIFSVFAFSLVKYMIFKIFFQCWSLFCKI